MDLPANDNHRLTILGLLSEEELARMLEVKPNTLAHWRARREGPDFTKVGKLVFYRLEDVREWLSVNVVVVQRTG